MMVRQTFMIAALTVGALSGIVSAQAPAKCEIDEGKPGQVKGARDALVTAGLIGKPDDKKKQITKAIGLLTTPQANANAVGRNWLLGRALVTLAAKPIDSAVAIAERALVIYPKSPVAYNVIGNARKTKDDIPGAVDAFKRMVVAIGSDTAYADEKKQAMMNIPQLLAAEADAAEAPKKQEYAKQAAEAYQAYLKDYPNDAGAQSGLARVQLLAGDSASANKIYSDMLAAPDKYTDMQLLEAGVNAARAERAK